MKLCILVWISHSVFYVGALRVAIIGSGIGGASFSLFASRAIPNAEISVFERDERIGGRAAFSGGYSGSEVGASLVWTFAG